MAKLKNGGPAFPEIKSKSEDISNGNVTDVYSEGGLTKREIFALAALQGLLASYYWKGPAGLDMRKISLAAFELADAMLRAGDE